MKKSHECTQFDLELYSTENDAQIGDEVELALMHNRQMYGIEMSVSQSNTVLLRLDLHAMLHIMQIFTGTDLHNLTSHVMVKVDLHFVSRYYMQCI